MSGFQANKNNMKNPELINSIQQIQTLYPDIWNAWDLEDKFAVAAKSQYPEGKSDVDVANR